MWVPRRVELLIESLIGRLADIQKAIQEQKTSVDEASVLNQQSRSRIERQLAVMRPNDEYLRGANTYKHRSYWQQVIQNCITGLGFFFALFALVISLETLKQIKKSTDAGTAAATLAQETFDATYEEHGIADRTTQQMAFQTAAQFQSAQSTAQANRIASEALKSAKDAFIGDKRAWLRVVAEMPVTLDPSMRVNVSVSNVGKSPALQILAGVTVQVVDADKTATYGKENAVRNGVLNLLFPDDQSFKLWSGRTPNNPDGTVRPLTTDELQRLASGNAYLAAYGIVAYRDQFGLHWTRYCNWKSYQQGPKEFAATKCVLWNAAGEGLARFGSPGDKEYNHPQ